jgi:hypothetical protein
MTVWHYLLLLTAYAAAASCLYAAYRIGITSGWSQGIRQFLIFVLFALLFYLLESWAHLRVPYYYYPPVMPDTIPLFDWSGVSWFPGPAASGCLAPPPPPQGMSLSVPLMEAALTFSVMWTAQLLRAPVLLQPFLGGLVFLAVDGFLDPVLALTIDCGDLAHPQLSPGAGIWEWWVYPELGARWFGIPLFNFAAWYAAPLVLISLVKLLDWLVALYQWYESGGSGSTGAGPPAPMPSLLEFAFLVILIVGFLLIFGMAPTAPWPVQLQGLILLLFVVGTLVATLWYVGVYVHDNPWRWEFIAPQILAVLLPTVVFLGKGLFLTIPYLWIFAIVSVALVVLFSLSPYYKA